MSGLKLYEITNEFVQAIEHGFEDGNFEEHFGKIKQSFDDKCIAVAKFAKGLEAEANAIAEAASLMEARAKSKAKQANSLFEYLKSNLEKSGMTSPVKCLEFDIKLQNNPGKLIIDDASKIPEHYKTVVITETIEIDKAKIKQDIKDDFSVDGCRIEVSKRLVIK